MEEPITFWLDNKICSGLKISEVGKQTLVSYREKYYIIVNGAALMKGVRPLHYSKTSLPLIWKKAIRGILPPPVAAIEAPDDEFLPATTSTKKERNKMPTTLSAQSDFAESQLQTTKTSASKKVATTVAKPAKIVQSAVAATCPYCNQKQDIPFEKGKNGKPFFVACSRCRTEFAVKFVPVTMYQAQVAAFK